MEGRNADCLRTFLEYCVVKEISKMDQRDQELLGKQLRQLNPSPRSDGVMILAFLAVFFTGMALGVFLFAYKSEPLQIASNDATTATSVPNGAPPTTLR
jgi:hypothetical protein